MTARARIVALASLLAATTLVAAPSASADGTKVIPLAGYRDMVVDDAHGHVFISQGTDQLVVTDLNGNLVTTIPQLYGADGLVLSDDGSALYVALSTGDAIGPPQRVPLAYSGSHHSGLSSPNASATLRKASMPGSR